MRSVVNASLDLSLLSTTAVSTVDTFVCVVPDTSIERAWVVFDQDVTGRGVLMVSLVQDLGDGGVIDVTESMAISEATIEPQELNDQTASVEPVRPIYLRVEGRPASGTTPWWGTATQLTVCLHLMTSVPADEKISVTESNPNPDVSTYQGD